MSAKLKINGQNKIFEGGLPETLGKLLDDLAINQATVVAEIDGCIIERKDFARTPLKEGQTIELIRFVGGG
ncbi:MAG TPA: sulfur carrier protein ThiS [Anaerohalosphaeraceae bacterium]|nr:sulfur carrier protein ThiS [Phycisphaerae bacterium]HOK94618.1 sulfur carrier protein ThiS [Anaerohalosphaeraceae bacterium]HOL32404.1 sulfur carrier protein ThiS [Anaerohalosphaeraceae bacterium]HOM74948.1 sulfur carrier protein ThiS [Anaerohalosphaeraceae bacterium]HPC63200.1 sulfur carrier protein ThiS [Anaerohalosphaeraceae bacterium]